MESDFDVPPGAFTAENGFLPTDVRFRVFDAAKGVVLAVRCERDIR